jgi:hypothetical protein
MTQDQQNFYWLFSSSAQTISAFVAFLITGYALVLNMMQNLEQKDETYEEIHHKMRIIYYDKLCWLAIVTVAAIISSLFMVYLNGGTFKYKWLLYLITVLINITAIIIGILFILSIINPDRYKKAAKEIIKEGKLESLTKANDVDQIKFINEFINLEKNIRDVLQKKQLYIPFDRNTKMQYSFREMVNALYGNELIRYYELLELLQINKYRNLIFHGHQDKVDSKMLDRIEKAKDVINKIK